MEQHEDVRHRVVNLRVRVVPHRRAVLRVEPVPVLVGAPQAQGCATQGLTNG